MDNESKVKMEENLKNVQKKDLKSNDLKDKSESYSDTFEKDDEMASDSSNNSSSDNRPDNE